MDISWISGNIWSLSINSSTRSSNVLGDVDNIQSGNTSACECDLSGITRSDVLIVVQSRNSLGCVDGQLDSNSFVA